MNDVNTVEQVAADVISDVPTALDAAKQVGQIVDPVTESRLAAIEGFCQDAYTFLMHHFPGAAMMPQNVPGLVTPVPVNPAQK